MARTVVIGVGNPVRSDDGVGLAVAHALRLRPELGCDVEEVSGGGLRLVEAMSGYDRAIVVDAAQDGTLAPGALRWYRLAELSRGGVAGSVHDTSLPEGLALWRAAGAPTPRAVEVLGVGVADLTTCREALTPAVAAAVGRAVEAIAAALAEEGRS